MFEVICIDFTFDCFQYTLLRRNIHICTYLRFIEDLIYCVYNARTRLIVFKRIITYSLFSHLFPENILFLLPYLPHSYKYAEFLILQVCSSVAELILCLVLLFLVFLGWVFSYLFCSFLFSHLISTILFTG